jgi:hypothetical protein
VDIRGGYTQSLTLTVLTDVAVGGEKGTSSDFEK